MNDLPENELFSAYLDGELSADEQAEMEQLLATNPAARQLLDELRELSATLQSLPQESLGEDLGPQVLRVAERRMLTGREHDPAEDASVPLARSVFRRLLNRRVLAWAGLALAIGAMISINEWRQVSEPLARVTMPLPAAANNRIVRKTDQPSVIRAGQDKNIALKNEAESPADADSEKAMTADMPAEPAAPPSFGSKITFDVTDAEQAEKTSPAAEGIMVIRCDISPKAAQRRALEKLLDANGMTWREQIGRERIEDKAPEPDGKKIADVKSPPRSDVSEEVNLVWVVATQAQIDATLAGLAAQPDVFLTHAVNPPSRELPEDVVQQFLASGRTLRQLVPGGGLFQFEQRVHVAGPTTERGAVGRLDMDVRESAKQLSKTGKLRSAVKSVEEKRPLGGPMKARQLTESASMQRVLFVLRVVDHDSPASTAESKSGSETAAPAAEPAPLAKPPEKKQ